MAEQLTRQQQQALARAKARKRKAEAEQIQSGGPSGFFPFFNKSVAGVAGAPVDITNWALGKAGLPVSDMPIGGSKSIEAGLAAIGAPTPQREPATTGESIGQVSGEVAASLIPMTKAAQVAQRGSGVVGNLSREFMDELVKRPVRSAAVETGGAAGAGVARQAGAEGDLSPGEQILAETIGAMGGSMTGLGALQAARMTPSALSGRAIRRAVFPFTEKGALERASRRIQSLVEDPVKAAGMIDDLKGSALLPSARTESPGLMALERTVLERDPAEAQRMSVRSAEAVQDLVGQIRQSGNVKTAQQFIEQKRKRVIATLDARVEQAADAANNALAVLGPDVPPAEASIIVRETLEQALADAKVQEAMLWQAIPQDTPVPTVRTIRQYEDIVSKLPSAQRDDIPPIARSIIENLGNEDTIAEMDGLYKKLGEVGRKARADKEFNKARIADELRDAILLDMDNAKGAKEAVDSIKTARAYSLELNKKFRQGSVGKILGYSREGGVALAPELTLGSTVGKGGIRGELARREISEATGGSPLAMEGVQNYIKARYINQAVKNGEFSPSGAETFLKQNAELVDSFPALKEQIMAARSADDVLRRVKDRTQAMRKRLDRKSVSAAATFLGEPVDRAMDAVMRTEDPAETMRKLVALASEKPEAVQGLKAGFSEWLVNRALSTSKPDILGRQHVYGLRLQAELANPSVQATMQKLYSKKEIADIERAVKELALFDRQSRTQAAGDIISDRPSRIIEIIGRVAGAKVGASLSSGAGASIQSAQLGSREAKNILQRLTADKARQIIIDAIEDPELMKTLLMNPQTKDRREIQRANRVLRSYFASRGSRLVPSEDEQE